MTQVLILLPFRNAALAVVQRLAALAQAETRSDSVQHKERFLREFGDEDKESQVPAILQNLCDSVKRQASSSDGLCGGQFTCIYENCTQAGLDKCLRI